MRAFRAPFVTVASSSVTRGRPHSGHDPDPPRRPPMTTEIVPRARERALRFAVALRCETGQGTVEYVALILLIAAVMTAGVLAPGVDAKGLASTIVNKLKHSIDTVGAHTSN